MMRLEIRAGISEQREAGRVRVVDNEAVGNEVVILFDAEVIRLAYTNRRDARDPVPADLLYLRRT